MNLHHQVSGSRPRQKRVKALVDCRAVGSEQLAFFKDEVIVVTATEDPHWWVSMTHSPVLLHFSQGQTPGNLGLIDNRGLILKP